MKWGLKKRDSNSNHSIDSFHRDIDRVFDDFFSLKPTTLFESEWLPKIDVNEDEKAIHVHAELPGMDDKDLNVEIKNNLLTITGEKKEEKEKKSKNSVVSERRFGSFSRTISLPEGIKSDNITAKFKKGVLHIELPKDEKNQPKKISVTVN